MALIDKASLLMVPSTYEAGKLYNVLPSGNRAPDNKGGAGYDQTRADFDFDRGSNAAATRIGSDGLLKKYRENLLVQSNQFDTTWGKVNISTTNGQEGYDGTNNAWKIEGTGSAAFSYLLQSESNNIVKTRSVYAKAGSVSYLGIWGSGSNFGYFDLSNGTLDNISGSSAITHSITDVGNGWYRCEFATTGSTSSFYIVASANANGTSLSTGDYIYIQSAQLESGLVATEVLTSGATTGKAGVLVDLPRINYDANGENGALLLEPSRLNKVIYSEYLDNATNTINGLSISQNQAISPEGVNNAAKIIEDTTSTIHRFGYSFPADTMAVSWYAKAGERNKIAVFTPPADIGYDLTGEGSIINLGYGTTGASIKSVGNGWYRCAYTFTFGSSAGVYMGLVNDSNQISYLGDGSSGAYIYGWQVESGSYPSSYIPNHGESGGVTRAADYGNGAGSTLLFNDTEGVLYLESSWLSNDLGTSTIAISDGSSSNRIILGYIGADDDLYCTSIGGGSSPSLMRYDVGDITTNHKIAIKYKANDFAFWVDGVERGTQSSGTTPVGLNELSFSSGTGGSEIFGNMKQILYFPTALTDTELATLTTL